MRYHIQKEPKTISREELCQQSNIGNIYLDSDREKCYILCKHFNNKSNEFFLVDIGTGYIFGIQEHKEVALTSIASHELNIKI